MNLVSAVSNYKSEHSKRLRDHLEWYSSAKDLGEAIERASRAEYDASGLMHGHQFRVGRTRLGKIEGPLTRDLREITGFNDFGELYSLVRRCIADLPGLGDLTVYDTALRLGGFFNVMPTSVYLQCGARKGALEFYRLFRNNESLPEGRSVPTTIFFPELQDLSPCEIENFLCIMMQSGSNRKVRPALC
jgi:hypothetical protein